MHIDYRAEGKKILAEESARKKEKGKRIKMTYEPKIYDFHLKNIKIVLSSLAQFCSFDQNRKFFLKQISRPAKVWIAWSADGVERVERAAYTVNRIAFCNRIYPQKFKKSMFEQLLQFENFAMFQSQQI